MFKFFFLLLALSVSTHAQDTLIFKSNLIPADDTTLVFFPSGKNLERTPLLILLHGWSGNYAQWNEIIDLQRYADEYGFLIAAPDGFYDSWYVNSPEKAESQIERFIISELIPKLIEAFNADSSNVFISGLSMGGHGALYLFFKYPDIFRSAGSTSGILDITQFSSKWGMEKILGDYHSNQQVWEEHSVHQFVKNIAVNTKEFIFDCGTEDFAYDVNARFYELCREKGLKAKFISQPGNHSRDYWERSIKDHLLFFSGLNQASH